MSCFQNISPFVHANLPVDTTAVDWLSWRPLQVCVTAGGMVCLAASSGSVAAVTTSVTTSEQAFQLTGSPVTVAGQVLAAKLPLPANSKIVTLNVPTAQGGTEHQCHPFLLAWASYLPEWMHECHVGGEICLLVLRKLLPPVFRLSSCFVHEMVECFFFLFVYFFV